MSLIGISRTTGERINILDYKYPKKSLKKGDVLCQVCYCELIIKHGNINIQHFAHKSSCSSDYKRHTESLEHIIGKELISKYVKSEWEEYSNCEIHIELPIASAKRIIDVAMVFKTGWIVAHEIQLSSITTAELDLRTKNYLDEGIDVIWWLGKNANTKTNREWAIKKTGACYTLDYEMLQERANTFRSQ